MKHPKLFLLLLLCFCISCEKDTLPEHGSESITENIHFGTQISTQPLSLLKEADPEFADTYNKLYTKSKGFASRGKADFSINPSKVVRIETQGYTTYTLGVHKEDSPLGSFDNLLIEINKIKGKTNVYLVHYVPEEDGIVQSEAHESFNFKGDISVNQIEYDVSGLLSERMHCRIITLKFCDWGGTPHVAGNNCTPDYMYDRTFQECDWVPGADSDPGFGGSGGPAGPGGGSTTPVLPWGEEDIAIMENVISRLTLNFNEKRWVREYRNLESVVEIYNFLQRYTSDEAEAFAEEAVEALMEGGKMDWEDRIIILVDKPCATGVINDANSLDNEIGQKMREAFDNDTNYNVIISNDNLQQDNPNMIKLAETYPILNGDGSIKSMNITFDNSYLNLATDISIFATAIHENIHALMFYQLDQMDITIDDPDVDYSILANEWSKAVATRQSDGNLGPSHLEQQMHEIMAGLVLNIADIIKSYADNKGYTISDIQAEALAWAGLQDSVAWAVMDEYLKETYENIIDYDATSFEILSVGVACN